MPNTFTHLRRLLLTAAIALGVLAGTANTATARDDDDGIHENSCSPQQLLGGYEDWGGTCVLTAYNWDIGGGQCLNDLNAEHGSGHQGGCAPTGCITATCGGPGLPPGGGGGSGSGSGGFDWNAPNLGIHDRGDLREACDALGGYIGEEQIHEAGGWISICFYGDAGEHLVQCNFHPDGTVECWEVLMMPAPQADPAGGVEHSGDGEVAEPASTGSPTTFPTAQLELADTTTTIVTPPGPTAPPTAAPTVPPLSTTPPCWSNPRISCAVSFEAT